MLHVNDHLEKDILLPTFTANLRGPALQAEVRSVYDPSSQTTFIKESLAQKLHCKVLHNIDLTVKGFNSRKASKAKLVEVLFLVGDKEFSIKAVTVPEFYFMICAPNLDKVVELFKARGYSLADKGLSKGQISDIEFMLGSNCAGILPVTSKLFSYDEGAIPSCYLDSPLGVMLQGSASLLILHGQGLQVRSLANDSA